MRRSSTLALSMSTVTWFLPFQQAELKAAERTRNFPAYHCRFTLAGEHWSWVDLAGPNQPANTLCGATDGKAFVVTLSYSPVPRQTQLDQKFVDGFEGRFFSPGKFKKRGGRFITFQGLPCYQAEAVMPDEKTAVARVFLAHGLRFSLGLVGGKEPIERDPEFEKIMNGFAFTVPPAQGGGGTPPLDAPGFSQFMGQVVFWCLLAAALLALLRWTAGRRKKA